LPQLRLDLALLTVEIARMSKDVDSTASAPGSRRAPSAKQREREQRLAAALRENLRKRKAQARARSAKEQASAGDRDQ